MTTFMSFWLFGWAMGEGTAIRDLSRPDHPVSWFLVAWLAFWTVAGIYALATVLWQLAGEVVLEVRQGVFRHRFSIGPLSAGSAYQIDRIHNLRASAAANDGVTWRRNTMAQLGRGVILFEYGERAVTIRPDLEPSEANNVVNMLNRHIGRGAA
jgi:hypothetical protein